MHNKIVSKAQGCLAGQIAGDALGSLVEFSTAEEIHAEYPEGVVEMQDGGTWNTIAGQPTDDSEMAILMAREMLAQGKYCPKATLERYQYWLNSNPFDCGKTIFQALKGSLSSTSQANGALMRISPLGIWGSRFDLNKVKDWAMQDAMLTHPHIVCQQVNALYATAISFAIQHEVSGEELFEKVAQWAVKWQVETSILECIHYARIMPPVCDEEQMGWVLIAFQNALYSLLHSKDIVEGIKHTIWRGGDTDTNAAICGALLGAVYGIEAIPDKWVQTLKNCRPEKMNPKVNHPRPESMWPTDFLEIAESLVS